MTASDRPPTNAVIRLENVRLKYKGEKRGFFAKPSRLEILKNLTVEFPPDSLTVLVGRSGAGKSALLRLLALQETGFEGKLFFDGSVYPDVLSRRQIEPRIGYLPQDAHVEADRNLTILDCVRRQAKEKAGVSAETLGARLKRYGLEHLRPERKLGSLSGGQTQAVLILAVLLGNPRVLLADQPFGPMDPQLREKVLEDVLLQKDRRDACSLIAANDLNLIRRHADYGILLREGEIVERNEARAFLDAPDHPETERFVQDNEVASPYPASVFPS